MRNNQKKKDYKMKPLMYIVQPDNQDINVNMQSFVVKKTKSKAVDAKQIEEDSQVKTLEKEPLKEEVSSLNTDVQTKEEEEDHVEVISLNEPNNLQGEEEQDQEQTVKQYRKQRKPITQMNIAEKIEFFKNLPKNMPRTLCQIETTNDTYRGVIMTEEDRIVTIRSLTHAKPIDVPFENIKSINLLGF